MEQSNRCPLTDPSRDGYRLVGAAPDSYSVAPPRRCVVAVDAAPVMFLTCSFVFSERRPRVLRSAAAPLDGDCGLPIPPLVSGHRCLAAHQLELGMDADLRRSRGGEGRPGRKSHVAVPEGFYGRHRLLQTYLVQGNKRSVASYLPGMLLPASSLTTCPSCVVSMASLALDAALEPCTVWSGHIPAVVSLSSRWPTPLRRRTKMGIGYHPSQEARRSVLALGSTRTVAGARLSRRRNFGAPTAWSTRKRRRGQEHGEEAGAGTGAARPCSPAPVPALRGPVFARTLRRRVAWP